MTALRRARPSLGTLVEMRVEGLCERDALRALDAAFAEVQQVHRCMSFHAADSDLARLHASAWGTALRVDARTHAVLDAAQAMAHESHGVFDVSVAAVLVQLGLLPRPVSAFQPDPGADWRDIELLDDNRVRLRRPLWIDLGGIAKGYAVDRAIEVLVAHGASHASVNAGGDLRLHGPRSEAVFLRVGRGLTRMPQLELADAALATSARDGYDDAVRPHLHGITRMPLRGGASASVVADRCMVADALTKVVLAADAQLTERVLCAFGAEACVLDPAHGWQRLGRAA